MKKGLYLKVPVKMATEETIEEMLKAEELNIEYDYEDELDEDYIYILVEGESTIHQFNRSEQGMVVVTVASGRWNTEMDFDAFLSKMMEIGYEIA